MVTALSCKLSAEADDILLVAGSKVQAIYQADTISEIFNCSYGLNPQFEMKLQKAGLQFTGRDQNDEVRVIELAHHPFFVATLFQPERSALKGVSHPIIAAFLKAAKSR